MVNYSKSLAKHLIKVVKNLMNKLSSPHQTKQHQAKQFSQRTHKTNKTQNTHNAHNTKHRPMSADTDIENFAQVNYLQVTGHQHEQRLDNFLLSRLKGLPRSHLYKMIRSDEIRINNKRCKPHDRLCRGDVVRVAPVRLPSREVPIISDKFAQDLMQRVVYEDDGLLVLDKPSGMAVHGGGGEDYGVIEAMRHVTGKKYLELVHRIDKDTSGLLMMAKKRSVLKQLQQHLRDKTIQKHYLCVVAGHLVLNEQLIDLPLIRYTLANGERRVRISQDDPQAKSSQTQIKVKQRFKLIKQASATDDKNDANTSQTMPVSFIEALPKTGRTHQIRVHLAQLGHALLGDDKYNPHDVSGVRRLCLHAWQLQIPNYPLICTDLPKDISELLPKDGR